MVEKRQLRIELTGVEAEKIVSDWISARMVEQGYKLDYSRNEDGPWPDTFWLGEEVPNVNFSRGGTQSNEETTDAVPHSARKPG